MHIASPLSTVHLGPAMCEYTTRTLVEMKQELTPEVAIVTDLPRKVGCLLRELTVSFDTKKSDSSA